MSNKSQPSASTSPSRRTWIKRAAAATVGTVAVPRSASGPSNCTSQRVLRLAHLTDIHVQPELDAERGLAA